jgi:hypothetical protein
MKCDSGQDGCQPCQSKNLRCVATDRITGHAYERGEAARLKKEVEELRAQLNAYYQHVGPPSECSLPNAYQPYPPPNGYSRYVDGSLGSKPPVFAPVLKSTLPAIDLPLSPCL